MIKHEIKNKVCIVSYAKRGYMNTLVWYIGDRLKTSILRKLVLISKAKTLHGSARSSTRVGTSAWQHQWRVRTLIATQRQSHLHR